MSVVIKEMKYPESCAECALWMYDDQGAMCPFKEHKYISDGGWQPPSDTEKGEWCPLVELPENHGPLIDCQALLEEARRLSGPFVGDGWSNQRVFALIARQPAIVEAEGDD